jgi:hypothetical protein
MNRFGLHHQCIIVIVIVVIIIIVNSIIIITVVVLVVVVLVVKGCSSPPTWTALTQLPGAGDDKCVCTYCGVRQARAVYDHHHHHHHLHGRQNQHHHDSELNCHHTLRTCIVDAGTDAYGADM